MFGAGVLETDVLKVGLFEVGVLEVGTALFTHILH